MNFFIILFPFGGGGGVLGKRMLNPNVLNCHETSSHWRHMYNKEKQWIISFSYVKTLTSLAIWGPGGLQ